VEEMSEEDRKSLRSECYNLLSENLLSTLGLVSFKLVTQLMAHDMTQIITDPSDRVYECRAVKELLRDRVIQGWKRTTPSLFKNHRDPRVRKVFSRKDCEDAIQEAIDDVEKWARDALDMTPTAEELMKWQEKDHE